ncbi:MAG: TetR/AcrR family transcriptional regulator [Defluviitaleaceae bacterium]|nr:TetR/AcrR family transcriptional regulator [Defluviitaleaceae bacterium]
MDEREHEHDEDFQKFQVLDEEKRERIINAAMKEFLSGYKKASTDNIVREAGISKGLLFHYFGTKERLHNFLTAYAIKTIQAEFLGLINVLQPDILDTIWQMSLLKRDVSRRYPDMFDFLTAAFVDAKTTGSVTENLAKMVHMRERILAEAYANADKSLFRDDIDSEMAINIINWAFEGFAQSKMHAVGSDNPGAAARENYDEFLEEFQKMLNMLRKCFYKKL